MKKLALLSLVLWTGCTLSLARVETKLKAERDLFLLYEPIEVEVSVKNQSGKELLLNQGWLSFLIKEENGEKIGEEKKQNIPERKLKAEEETSVKVNLTPWYGIRKTGQYEIKAVVDEGQGDCLVTIPLMIHISSGHVVWSQNREEKTYELIKFLNREKVDLYLRVQQPDQNQIWTTVKLGSVSPHENFQEALFDSQGRLHTLYPLDEKWMRYVVAGPKGDILKGVDYGRVGIKISLAQKQDGSVQVLESR